MANRISDKMVKALGSHNLEDLIMKQVTGWVKNLPPLPPGWVYDFIPGEPVYNAEKKTWETTMVAKPRQKYIIKED